MARTSPLPLMRLFSRGYSFIFRCVISMLTSPIPLLSRGAPPVFAQWIKRVKLHGTQDMTHGPCVRPPDLPPVRSPAPDRPRVRIS